MYGSENQRTCPYRNFKIKQSVLLCFFRELYSRQPLLAVGNVFETYCDFSHTKFLRLIFRNLFTANLCASALMLMMLFFKCLKSLTSPANSLALCLSSFTTDTIFIFGASFFTTDTAAFNWRVPPSITIKSG